MDLERDFTKEKTKTSTSKDELDTSGTPLLLPIVNDDSESRENGSWSGHSV